MKLFENLLLYFVFGNPKWTIKKQLFIFIIVFGLKNE